MNVKRQKSKIKYKINIIYDSKMKSDIIGRKIRRKTWILTRDRAWNDPIDHQIKGFSFRNFKDNRRNSRSNFSLFSPQNITFKHFLNMESDLEKEEIKRFKDWDVLTIRLLKTPLNGLHSQRTCIFISRFGRDRWIWLFIFNQRLRWNAWMRIIVINSRLFDRRWSAHILPCRTWRISVT